MEEPVKPTRVERSEMQQIAAAIVESVRVNEKMPLPGLKTVVIPYDAGVFFDAIKVEGFVLKLAQAICETTALCATAIARAEAAERACERLRGLHTEALNMLDGYITHRADMLEHIAATCEDDTTLADTERAQQAVAHDEAEFTRFRSLAGGGE